jgi:hypothetical protein
MSLPNSASLPLHSSFCLFAFTKTLARCQLLALPRLETVTLPANHVRWPQDNIESARRNKVEHPETNFETLPSHTTVHVG